MAILITRLRLPHVSYFAPKVLAAETSPRPDYGRTCPKSPPRVAGEISLFHLPGDTVAVEHDPLAEALRVLLDAQSSVAGGFTVKKRPIAIKLGLLLLLCLVIASVYRVRGVYDARAHRAACYRANLEKENSLEPSPATINTELQSIQLDQDAIDRLGDTDDDTVIQRRNRIIDGVKLKLTKVNQDRAEGQRRAEQIRVELSSCLADVK